MSDIANEVYISDLDIIYLSYDEPQCEKFWVEIKNMMPWAKRVHGVKGSDAAHKAAADQSDTERFVVIDGDNLPNVDFFDQILKLNLQSSSAQFRWRARNIINDIHYGNGGLSCWTREHVWGMKTHEHSEGDDKTKIEFCFHPLYWAMHDCYSTTYPNYSPRQAWRAGFREGVKLCTRNGAPNKNREEFAKYVWPRNMKNLLFWQTLGRDVENGFWAMLGARTGTHYLMLREWDYVQVQDFDRLNELWSLHQHDDEDVCRKIGQELNKYLGTNIVEYDADQSRFFKQYGIQPWRNMGIMTREIDVIRSEEGW